MHQIVKASIIMIIMIISLLLSPSSIKSKIAMNSDRM